MKRVLFGLLLFTTFACSSSGDGNNDNSSNNGNNQNNSNNVNNSTNVNNTTGSNNANNSNNTNNTTNSNNQTNATGCNGFDALCGKRFDEVVLAATHNSMSNEEEGWTAPNQDFSVARQLEDGVRGFLLDSVAYQDDYYFCHFSCTLGRILVVELLAQIKAFLDANPREVIAMIIQDAITPAETEALFIEAGLTELLYAHDGGEWPTLQEMIDANTRVVVTAEVASPPPAWYLHAWDTYFDTPYTFVAQGDFTCDLNRGAADNDLFLVNHWLTNNGFGSPDGAQVVNEYTVLYERATTCQQERGHLPNMLAVDFYGVGDLLEVVNVLNGVAPPR